MIKVTISQFTQSEENNYEIESVINDLYCDIGKLRNVEDFLKSTAVTVGFPSGTEWVARNITADQAIYKTDTIINDQKQKIRLEAKIRLASGHSDMLKI